MGNLVAPDASRRFTLGPRQIVGRSRRSDIVVGDQAASAEHAVLLWDGATWTVRDLASRNGTWVGSEKLEPGAPRALAAGDALAFGDPSRRWVLAGAEPPHARAVGPSTVEVADGFLSLPPGEEPELVLYEDARGWVCERGEQVDPVEDQDVVRAGGVDWRLELPAPVAQTTDLAATTPSIDVLGLSFAVSSDEEHVELVLDLPTGPIELAARAHHYTLLTLARLRMKDADDPQVSPAAAGWVHIEDLARMLAMDPAAVNVQIFRARKQLGAAGVVGAARLVERRPDSRQLRLGVGRLSVRTL